MKLIKVISIVLGLIVLCVYAKYAVSAFKNDMELYEAETKCIKGYVALGIERADIAQGNGTCWVKQNDR
ncbi:hypothetical protein [Vibrio phage PhiImVa-1]|nr:hypothetical protein [Vibrio phage PhiImVa-1]